MAGLALIARQLGHEVEGSDAAFHPPMADQLAAAGIGRHEGFAATVAQRRAELYLIGNVVRRGNPLFESILAARAPFASGPAWLAANVLGAHAKVVAVAGTHGKTTTAAMVVHILKECGRDPSWLLGGLPGDGSPSGHVAAGRELCVIEADEYDTALFDKRPKFCHYWCDVAILNNIEFDHSDIYPDLAAILRQFALYPRCIRPGGTLVANRADADVASCAAAGAWHATVWFNDPGGWSYADGRLAGGAGGPVAVAAPPAGAHNLSNMVAAVAACAELGVEPADAVTALAGFALPARRMELVCEAGRVKLIDDFAHHPTSLRLTLETVRAVHRPARVIALFEPGSNTMRAGHWAAELAAACAPADHLHVYARGLGWDVAAALAGLGDRLSVHEDIEALHQAAVAQARPGDVLVMLSNAAFGGLRPKLAASVAALRAS